MERTKSDWAKITQSIVLFDTENNSVTYPCPKNSWMGTPTQRIGARRGRELYGRILSCAQRAYGKSARSKVFCRALWGNCNEWYSLLGGVYKLSRKAGYPDKVTSWTKCKWLQINIEWHTLRLFLQKGNRVEWSESGVNGWRMGGWGNPGKSGIFSMVY